MTKKILRITVLLVFVLSMLLLVGCNKNVSAEKHAERIGKLIEKRYIETGEYTGYQLHPLYNENDELKYFLIDFEPTGYVYISINKNYNPITHLFGSAGKYLQTYNGVGKPWQRYRYCVDGVEPEPYNGIQWKVDENKRGYNDYLTMRWEVDENGDYIEYTDSHFKVANMQNEKGYLLYAKRYGHLFPAVKRGDKYLNLISMEEIVYDRDADQIPIAFITFVPKRWYDL